MTAMELLTVEQVPIDQLRRTRPTQGGSPTRSWTPWSGASASFGFVQPVLARKEDDTVIGGHQRLLAARRLGLATVPVTYLDVSIEQARLLNLALNKIGGSWDEQLLARLLADLQATPNIDLTLSGFGEDEIKDLLRSLETREKKERAEDFDLDSALEDATRTPRSKPGDLWALGEHRLLCGDATKPEDVEKLLAGVQASMAFTDPPYNVSLGDHGGQQRGSRKRRIANDSMDPIAWRSSCGPGPEPLVQRRWRAVRLHEQQGDAPGLPGPGRRRRHWSDTIIWHKDRFVLGRAAYQRAYEPIWFGWREGASHHWCGDRDQDDVWEISRPGDSPLHPTMKPLPLMERAIANSSTEGDLVLDPSPARARPSSPASGRAGVVRRWNLIPAMPT